MAKALMGSFTTPKSIALLDEVRALRARVAQLEAALAEAEAVRAERERQDVEVVALDSSAETVSA